MEVHFTPEQEARLAKLASTAGTQPEMLVKSGPQYGKVSPRQTEASLSTKNKWTPSSKKCCAHKCASAGSPPHVRICDR